VGPVIVGNTVIVVVSSMVTLFVISVVNVKDLVTVCVSVTDPLVVVMVSNEVVVVVTVVVVGVVVTVVVVVFAEVTSAASALSLTASIIVTTGAVTTPNRPHCSKNARLSARWRSPSRLSAAMRNPPPQRNDSSSRPVPQALAALDVRIVTAASQSRNDISK